MNLDSCITKLKNISSCEIHFSWQCFKSKMSSEEKDNQGIPIYEDPVNRKIMDATGDEEQNGEWQPMNKPAEWLCKCVEGLKDVKDAIEHFNHVQTPKKQRRRLRGIFVPLHALCVSIVDLIHSIQADKTIHSSLPANCIAELSQLQGKFENLVPFRSKGKLAILRNKVSAAHYDKAMSPSDMRELIKNVTSSEVGDWINICIGVLSDLLKLDVYRWSVEAPEENTAVIFCETDIPIMSVVDVNIQEKRITGLRGMYLTTSPRLIIFETIKELVRMSDSLFEDGAKYKFRIKGYYEDPPGVNWSSMLRST